MARMKTRMPALHGSAAAAAPGPTARPRRRTAPARPAWNASAPRPAWAVIAPPPSQIRPRPAKRHRHAETSPGAIAAAAVKVGAGMVGASSLLVGCAAAPELPWRVASHMQTRDSAGTNAAAGYLALGQRYEGEQRPLLAQHAYRQAAATASDDAELLHALGLGLVRTGDLGEGIALLRRAAGMQPSHARFANNLGYALMLAGRDEEALPQLQKALAFDPGHAAARANLDRLARRTYEAAALQAALESDGQGDHPARAQVSVAAAPVAGAAAARRQEAAPPPQATQPLVLGAQAAPVLQVMRPNVASLPIAFPAWPPGAGEVAAAMAPAVAADAAATQAASKVRATGRADSAAAIGATARNPDAASTSASGTAVREPAVTAGQRAPARTAGPARGASDAAIVPVRLGPPAASAASTAIAPPPLGGMRVDVVNGNGVSGMAARVRGWLQARGAAPGRLGNQRPFDVQTTVVKYRDGHADEARALALALGSAATLERMSGPAEAAALRVVIGKDLAGGPKPATTL